MTYQCFRLVYVPLGPGVNRRWFFLAVAVGGKNLAFLAVAKAVAEGDK